MGVATVRCLTCGCEMSSNWLIPGAALCNLFDLIALDSVSAYRLCPLEENLTEECFQHHHLSFAGKTFLEFGNGCVLVVFAAQSVRVVVNDCAAHSLPNATVLSTRLEIESRFLSNGTHPHGSMWAMNPLPFANAGTAPQFAPPCTGAHDWHNNTRWGLCAGRFPIDVTIVDVIQLPVNLTPGVCHCCCNILLNGSLTKCWHARRLTSSGSGTIARPRRRCGAAVQTSR